MSAEGAGREPTGFVATCQCGVVTGAMDYARTDRKEAGKILGEWLARGCTVAPRFDGEWSVHVKPCECAEESQYPTNRLTCPRCGAWMERETATVAAFVCGESYLKADLPAAGAS